jgi:hypothetical protein
MQTSYGGIFQKKTSVAAINIPLGVSGRRADKRIQALPSVRKSTVSISNRSRSGPKPQINERWGVEYKGGGGLQGRSEFSEGTGSTRIWQWSNECLLSKSLILGYF